MQEVMLANPYRPGTMGSLGNAKYMIIRQFQFPFSYHDNEKMLSSDHDRCMNADYDHSYECIRKYTKTGELGLGDWFNRADDNQIMNFIKEITKEDVSVKWTGYRILGTVHLGNGSAIWTLQLFAKNPNSDTLVYSEIEAPNVRVLCEK